MLKIENLKIFILRIWKHRTFKNVGYLTISNIVAQFISLIGAFYIPRLLGPVNYGIYNTVLSYVLIFSIFSFSGMNKAIVRESSKDLSQVKEILELTIGFRFFASIFSAIVSVIFLLFLDYDNATKFYIILFSSYLIVDGLQTSLNTVHQAFEEMKIISVFAIVRQIALVGLSIISLKAGYGIWELIIINLAVNTLILICNKIYTNKIVEFNIFSKIRFIKKYIISGFYFSLMDSLNLFSNRIDIVMLSFLTTPQNVGLYAFAQRLSEKGLIMRTPISQSLFPFYTKKMKQNNMSFKDLIIHSAIITIPSIIIVVMVISFSELFIVKIVGATYKESAAIINVLVYYLFFSYIVLPFGLALQVKGFEKYYSKIQVIRAILNIILNYLLFLYYGIIGIAYSTLIVFFVINLFIIIKSKKLLFL